MDDFAYPLMEPPFPAKPFDEMSLAEARQHFDWFVGQSAVRRGLLLSAIRATGGFADTLDYSGDSLAPLWAWAREHLVARELKPEELSAFHAQAPAWVNNAGITPKQMTPGTQCLCVDIGFYFAEVFIRRSKGVRWTLCRQKTVDYNRPCLAGFGVLLMPARIVESCAWARINHNVAKDNPHELFRCYTAWLEKLTG